jgi:hypothetical protein
VDPKQKRDFETLLQHVEPSTRPLLEEFGGFYPFAVVLTRDGRPEGVDVKVTDERPSPKELLHDLVAILRERSHQYRAIGICADGTVPVEGGGRADAVVVKMEHAYGESLEAAIPYLRTDDGVVRYGPTRFARHKAQVFGA